MPHIVIEYSANAVEGTRLLTAVHEAVMGCGLFEASDVKTRVIPVELAIDGGGDRPFIHVAAKLLSGRTELQRAQLSECILAALETLALPHGSFSVETQELHRESYRKIVR